MPSNTLSGRINKVVASHAKVAMSIPARGCTDLYYARGTQGYCPWGQYHEGGATS